MGSQVADASASGAALRTPRDVKRELQRRLQEQSGYDVFISFAHESDAELAEALERGLEGWARPWYGGRAMRVFRYVSKMSASSDLEGDLSAALRESRWLIVVLSEEAAGDSPWVDLEIAEWRKTDRDDRILLVVADGKLGWDPTIDDFSADSTCVPDALRGAFERQPRYVDLRERNAMSWREWRRAKQVATRDLATKIHDIPADVLEGAHRSTIRATRMGFMCIALFLIAAAAFALLAVLRGREATKQQNIAAEESAVARADALAAAALDTYDDDVGAGLLRAVEALLFRERPETRAAVMAGLVHDRHLEQVVRVAETPYRIALSPDEHRLAVFSLDQRLRIFDLEERTDLADERLAGGFVESMVFDETGEHLALLSEGGTVEIRSVDDLATLRASSPGEGPVRDVAFAGGHVYVGHAEGIDQIAADTGERIRVVEGGVSSIATDASARHLALTRDNVVQVWDISVQPPDGIEEVVRTTDVDEVGISPAGEIVSFTEAGTIARWQRPAVTVLTSVQIVPDVVATQPTEAVAGVIAVQSIGRVALWAPWLADLVEIDVGSGGYDTPPATGTRGRRVAAVSESVVTIWRTDQPYTIATPVNDEVGVPVGEAIHVDVSPDSSRVLVAGERAVTLWDAEQRTLLATLDQEVPCAARFTDDGDHFLTVAERTDGSGVVVEKRAVDDPGAVLTTSPIALGQCSAGEVDISRNGQVVAFGSEVRAAATGDVLASTGRSAIDTTLSADGTQLWWTSSGIEEGGEFIGTLDVATGTATEHRTGQTTWGVDHATDGTTAAGLSTAGDEGAIAVWDAAFRRVATLPRVHLGTKEPAGEDPALEVAVGGNGERLATAGYLGTATVWELGPEASIAAACEIANRGLTATESRAVEAALEVPPTNPCGNDVPTSAAGQIGPLEWDPDAPTTDFDAGTNVEPDGTPAAEPAPADGYARVRDDTQTFTVDVPEEWGDVDTAPRAPFGSDDPGVPTVVASTDLPAFGSTTSTSGVLVQLLPGASATSEELGELLMTISERDRQACVVAGNLDLGTAADLLLRCDGARTHVAYAAQTREDGAQVVVMRFVLASTDDPPHMEAVKRSVTITAP